MRGDALQTFKNLNNLTRENLGKILEVFRRNYLKPKSVATAKHIFQKLVFKKANQNLFDFIVELKKLAEDAFGVAAHCIIQQYIYAKLPPYVKKSKNQAHSEKGSIEEIVTHLENDIELNGLEAPGELPINTVSQHATNTNTDRPKPTRHYFEKPGHYRNQCHQLKRQNELAGGIPNSSAKGSSGTSNSLSNNDSNNKNNKTKTEQKKGQKLFTQPKRHAEKHSSSLKNYTLEPM